MLDRRLSLLIELSRMKYFWAWEATWVGVREITKLREMLRQSPFPNLASPSRNSLAHHKHRHRGGQQGKPGGREGARGARS